MPTPRTSGAKTSTGAKTSSGSTTKGATAGTASDAGAAPEPEGTTIKLMLTMDDLKPAERKLAEAIVPFYAFTGTLLKGIGEQKQNSGIHHTGRALMNLSEKVAVQWVVLARTNKTVANWLNRLVDSASSGGLLTLHLLLLAPLMVTNGIVNPVTMVAAGIATGDIDLEDIDTSAFGL